MKAVWARCRSGGIGPNGSHRGGNHYFPPHSIRKEYFDPSETHSACPWKGTASYYHIHVGNQNSPDAGWYYPEPKDGAKSIKGYIAFWRGVKVID